MFVYLIWQTRKKIFRTLKISIFNISKYYKKDTKGVKIVFMLNFPPNVFMLNKKKEIICTTIWGVTLFTRNYRVENYRLILSIKIKNIIFLPITIYQSVYSFWDFSQKIVMFAFNFYRVCLLHTYVFIIHFSLLPHSTVYFSDLMFVSSFLITVIIRHWYTRFLKLSFYEYFNAKKYLHDSEIVLLFLINF